MARDHEADGTEVAVGHTTDVVTSPSEIASTDPASTDPASTEYTGPANEEHEASPWRVRGLIAALIALALITGTLIFSMNRDRNDLRTQNNALRRSLEIARGDAGEQIQQLEDANADLTDRIAELLDELVETQLRIDEISDERDLISDELSTTSEELVAEQELVADLESQFEAVGAPIVPMPDLLGRPIEEAQEFADELDAVLLVQYARPAGVISPPDTVIDQLPAEGITVVPGSVVWIQVYGVAG